jgi:16S rRNA (uracil1498-N3)-methyltransferase
VTKHRFLVPADHRQGGTVGFSTEQAHQLKSVLRLRAGDQVRVFDGERPCDRLVELVSWTEGRVVGQVSQAAEPRTRLVAYPSLLAREKFETVLQQLTQVGANAIVPVRTQRSLVREPPDERRLRRWRAIVREATEQSGRGVVPEVRPTLAFQAAVEQAVGDGIALLAYEAERRRGLRQALSELAVPGPEAPGSARDAPISVVSLFVGPEGGFTAAEAEHAEKAGVRLVTLGPRVLRSETASPVLAALVLHELGDIPR